MVSLALRCVEALGGLQAVFLACRQTRDTLRFTFCDTRAIANYADSMKGHARICKLGRGSCSSFVIGISGVLGACASSDIRP